MVVLVFAFSYLLGAVPTAYIAGRLLKGRDIREMGDGNSGAQNAFRELSPAVGIAVGVIDASKGALAVLAANSAGLSPAATLAAGLAAVAGHNWPVFIGFRGGRGEATTIGIFLMLLTVPMLIVAGPATVVLFLKKDVTLASVFLFVPLPLVGWWQGVSGMLIAYGIALPALIGLTHLLRARRAALRQA